MAGPFRFDFLTAWMESALPPAEIAYAVRGADYFLRVRWLNRKGNCADKGSRIVAQERNVWPTAGRLQGISQFSDWSKSSQEELPATGSEAHGQLRIGKATSERDEVERLPNAPPAHSDTAATNGARFPNC